MSEHSMARQLLPDIQHVGPVEDLSKLRQDMVEQGTVYDPASAEQHAVAQTQSELIGQFFAQAEQEVRPDRQNLPYGVRFLTCSARRLLQLKLTRSRTS